MEGWGGGRRKRLLYRDAATPVTVHPAALCAEVLVAAALCLRRTRTPSPANRTAPGYSAGVGDGWVGPAGWWGRGGWLWSPVADWCRWRFAATVQQIQLAANICRCKVFGVRALQICL